MRYRLIDHTADLGLHVFGTDLSDLYESAALAMFEQIVDAEKRVGRETADLAVSGADRADLMVNWLRELLYLWAGEQKLVKTVRVDRVTHRELTASVTWDLFESERHDINNDIKAVTYHQIRVSRCPSGWEARVIFDV